MKTIHTTLEGPANALSTNKDANQVAVAGRNVFKLFSIEEDEFVEKLNLRVGKNLNLNFSCADVVWNPVEDHILATAATNGAVLTWNINKSSRSKQDIIFQDHKRTVNKVCFHTIEPQLLLSGSQDGTMKCFDLRKREATTTFYSQSESVRDVQFSPHHYFLFAAVQENGNVQLWDLRRPDRCERQFTAHNGPVFTCDWHPEEKKWLATAGRDKTIKVWDIAFKPALDHCIQTIASVARVKWRSQRKYNIASSSLVVDFSINIWDIRRPYIPFAAFDEHRDVATGFAWRHDPHILLSTSKDCTLYQHVFRDATRPADHAIPTALTINNRDDIFYAVSDRIVSESNMIVKGSSYSATRLPIFFRKVPNLSEQFRSAFSFLLVFNSPGEDKEWFTKSACRYQLTGRPFTDLCEHNASVAAELHRPHICQAWRILKLLYHVSPSVASVTDCLWTNGDKTFDTTLDSSNQRTSRHNSGNRHTRHATGSGNNDSAPAETPGATEDESEVSDQERDKTLADLVSGMGTAQGDFFFGDGDAAEHLAGFDYNQLDAAQDWTLPNEAFQLRHAITDCSPPPDMGNSYLPSGEDDNAYGENTTTTSDAEDYAKLLPPSALLNVRSAAVLSRPSWSSTEVVIEMLKFYASQGEVQMAVSALIVLGDRLKGHIDETTQEQWFTSYIDLLSRCQLWNVANSVITLCTLSCINTLNQQSTVIHSICARCQRPLNRIGWLCEKCKEFPAKCSVCHQVVRGLYVWCQGCCHGGHVHHIQDWLQDHQWCPTGCGHMCEYT